MARINSRQTPYDDKYGTCERTDVRLLIYTGPVDPKWVDEMMKIEEASVLVKGQEIINLLGRTREIKASRWCLTTGGVIKSLDIRHHLDWLLDRLEPRAHELQVIQEKEEVQMTVKCVWWSAVGHGGPTLWPEQMERLARLNLELGFDIYFFGEEDD